MTCRIGGKITQKILSKAVVVFLLAAIALSGCAAPVTENEGTRYASFCDVPGVTDGEIEAIEAFIREGRTFLYGTIVSTETFRGEDGETSGFTAFLCDWLSEFFGVTFKIGLYEWDEMISGLSTGEIDFTGELTATPERRETYYMTDAIAERLVKYIRIEGSEPLAAISADRVVRFAFLEGVTTVDDVRASMTEPFDAIFVSDYAQAYRQLKSGEADAFIDESTAEAVFDIYGDVTVEDFYPLIYGPVSLATQNPANAPIISIIQKYIQSGGMRHLTELYNLGAAEYTKHKLSMRFTPAETEYLRDAPVIKFVAEHDNYPVSFYNEYDGQFQGAFHDVLRELEVLTGLRFEQVNGPDDGWTKILGMLENGEAAMISELIQNPERKGRFLWPDAAILTDYYALLSKMETADVNINEVLYMKVGLVDGYAHTDVFRSWFPGHADAVEYPSFDEAFSGLESGEVDMIMASQNQLLTHTNFREQPGYKANIVFDYPYDSVMGFHRDEAILCSVIEKALHVIPTQEISGGWMRKTYDYRAKVAQSRLPWLIGALLSVTCVLALLLVLFSRIKREIKWMTQFQNVIMETMAELVEYRDGTMGGHIERTSAYLDLMLREMQARGLYREQTSGWNIKQMVLSAQLHDVGKVAIADSILGKPGKLTAQEFDEMKRHTVIGS